MTKNIITWDLGATKCTAGLVEFNSTTNALNCKKHTSVKLTAATSLEDLIRQLEIGLDFALPQADAICIGAAGHYDGKNLLLEGVYPYPMHFARTATFQRWPNYAIIHDYASIVCATFTSYMEQKENIKRLNSCEINPLGRRVALGIGTGLGLKDGVLLANGDFWLGKNEMGHIGIPTPPSGNQAHLKRHQAIMHYMHEHSTAHNNMPITFEKLLSGQGTVRLYKFFYPNSAESTPEEIGIQMRAGKVPEMMDAFAWYIGLFVGTVQLTFMPEGGVWITGGVALNHLDVFDRPDFSAGIYASPAYLMQREDYALGVMCNHEHALLGCGYYASKRLLQTSSNKRLQMAAL